MGYILPVNHYQYSDYQSRMIKVKPDPFHIEKPYKTILRSNYYDYHKDQTATKQMEGAGLKLSTPKPPTADKLYAELTGKGRNFSSII